MPECHIHVDKNAIDKDIHVYHITCDLSFCWFIFCLWFQAYVTCALGMSYIGWLFIPQGAVSTPLLLFGGMWTRKVGRMVFIIMGMSSNRLSLST